MAIGDGWPHHMSNLPQQMMERPHGCICPPGAEQTCRGIGCPRNPPMTQKMVNGELVWVR